MQDTSYVAEPTAGTCILCPDPATARVPHHPPVCDACRSWLAGLVADVRILDEQLAQPEPTVRDTRVGTVETLVWVTEAGWATLARTGPSDPVANAQPAGPVPSRNRDPRVSGTHGAPVPPNLTKVDLTLRAWPGSVGPHTRGVLGKDEEQVGELSLATVLEGWVGEFRTHRNRGEGWPEPTVDAMTRWLQNRVEWACDDFEEVPSFADDIRQYRSAMRRVLGLSDRDEYKDGVRCPKCKQRKLYRRNGSDWVECGSCPAIMSPAEYRTHIGEDAATADTPEAEAA